MPADTALALLRRRAELAVVVLLAGVSAEHLVGAFILTVRRYYLERPRHA